MKNIREERGALVRYLIHKIIKQQLRALCVFAPPREILLSVHSISENLFPLNSSSFMNIYIIR